MQVLVVGEFTGVVRDAFSVAGHTAYSCDLLPTRSHRTYGHFQGEYKYLIAYPWDLLIVSCPANELGMSLSAYREKKQLTSRQQKEYDFFIGFFGDSVSHIDRICVESTSALVQTLCGRKADQIIQPSQFFPHVERKKYFLWLKNLPPLVPTVEVLGCLEYASAPRERSARNVKGEAYEGIAEAMVRQWGNVS